jgi:hypothetical protein
MKILRSRKPISVHSISGITYALDTLFNDPVDFEVGSLFLVAFRPRAETVSIVICPNGCVARSPSFIFEEM